MDFLSTKIEGKAGGEKHVVEGCSNTWQTGWVGGSKLVGSSRALLLEAAVGVGARLPAACRPRHGMRCLSIPLQNKHSTRQETQRGAVRKGYALGGG